MYQDWAKSKRPASLGTTREHLSTGLGLIVAYFRLFAILRCAVTVGTMPFARSLSVASSPGAE